MITHLAPWCGSLLPKVKYRLTTDHKRDRLGSADSVRIYIYTSDDPILEKLFPSLSCLLTNKPKLAKISFKTGRQTHTYRFLS